MADAGPCRCGRGTLYDVLQVSPWCEPEVIQAAYRALARTRHPDLNRDPHAEDQMRRLNLAYQTLSDPLQRARYDEELALALARTGVQRASAAASSTVGRFDIDDRDARPTPPHDETAYRSAARHATGRARAEASGSPSRSAASPASPASAYQAMIFDQRSEAMLSRSAIYLVVVLVTVILSLFVYIVIDIVALDGPATPRGPRTQSERTWNASGPASSPYSPILSGVDADARPGLSPSGERWNR